MRYYYAVAGINGYGVVDSYATYENKSRKYIKYSECKRFDSFNAATTYSRDRFEELNRDQGGKYNCIEPDNLRLNDLIFRKNLPQLVRTIRKICRVSD